MLDQLSKVINENAKIQKGSAGMKLQRCFAIRGGINGLLDVARRTYSEVQYTLSGSETSLIKIFFRLWTTLRTSCPRCLKSTDCPCEWASVPSAATTPRSQAGRTSVPWPCVTSRRRSYSPRPPRAATPSPSPPKPSFRRITGARSVSRGRLTWRLQQHPQKLPTRLSHDAR